MTDFKNYFIDQDSVRNEILEIIKNNPSDIAPLAKEIGINRGTLNRFLMGEKCHRLKTISKMVKWVQNKKK